MVLLVGGVGGWKLYSYLVFLLRSLPLALLTSRFSNLI